MECDFFKYHGAGNDFVMFDGRDKDLQLNAHLVSQICDRRFGIGADGLIEIKNNENADFEILYFNADGHVGSMCGNGGRCAARLAHRLGIAGSKTHFMAYDGMHEAEIISETSVALKMRSVNKIDVQDGCCVLDTGSPHYVTLVEDVSVIDVVSEGRKIRHSHPFAKEGINVNFVQANKNGCSIRTYERGVEDETLACGTGVTAVALVLAELGHIPSSGAVSILTRGGELSVRYNKKEGSYEDVWLLGPVKEVYKGLINLNKM